MNWDVFHGESSREFLHRLPLHRFYTFLCGESRCKCQGLFICRRTTATGKIANNGLRSVPYTIEMWVMWPKEQKFVYTRMEAVRWIERRGAFLWGTQGFNGAPKRRTKFGVILGRRHNETFPLSSITVRHFALYFSHTRVSINRADLNMNLR